MQRPVSDATPGFHPSGLPAAVQELQYAVFAQQGDVPATGSPPGDVSAPAVTADSVKKHNSQVPLYDVVEAPAHIPIAGPGI